MGPAQQQTQLSEPRCSITSDLVLPTTCHCEVRSEMLKLKHTADMVGGAISSSMNWWTASFRFVQNPLSATSLSQDKRGASCITISCKSVCLKTPREETTMADDACSQHCCKLLPLSINVCRHDLRVNNFDSIYRKYVQHFYLQINLLKN